jgi:uncharacterized membrane protein
MAELPPKPGARLKFIDLARSIAILLMLEGHFVEMTLLEAYRDPGHPIFSCWNYIRGLAAPMFFTVTGLVFVYLLTGQSGPHFFQQIRVKKGLKRILELLFWGYLLQINLWNFPRYFSGQSDPWLSAFHVLQCIGIGLLILISVAGLQRLVKPIPLPLLYALTAFCLLLFYGYLGTLPLGSFVPEKAPSLIQNAIVGPRSVFPIAPWMIFTLYGGAFGALLRYFPEKIRRPWFPFAVLGCGLLLKFAGGTIDDWIFKHFLGVIGSPIETPWTFHNWIHVRVGEIVAILGILILIENRFPLNHSWFLKIGQNTFPIYVLHVILLYNGIFGIGLASIFWKLLSPWQAALGAVLFMAFFALFANLLDAWKGRRPRQPISG